MINKIVEIAKQNSCIINNIIDNTHVSVTILEYNRDTKESNYKTYMISKIKEIECILN